MEREHSIPREQGRCEVSLFDTLTERVALWRGLRELGHAPRAELRAELHATQQYRLFVRRSESAVATGIPIVLLHGCVLSSMYMVPLAVGLGVRHPVYAPDLPGSGYSDKPARPLDVCGLADVLGEWMERLAPAVVVASSSGCQIAVELAARESHRLRGLILLGPTTDATGRSLGGQLWRWLRNGLAEPAGLGAILAHDYLRFGVTDAVRAVAHMLDDHIEHKLELVQVPTLVVRGQRDTIVSRRWAKEVAGRLPAAKLVEIPRAAHTLNYDAVPEMVGLVSGFVRGLSVKEHAPRPPRPRPLRVEHDRSHH